MFKYSTTLLKKNWILLITLTFAFSFTNAAMTQEDNQQSSEEKVVVPPVNVDSPDKDESTRQGAENSPPS